MSEKETVKKSGQIFGSEFPKTEEGKTYHVMVKKGEVANRVICVGDLARAKKFSLNFDDQTKVFENLSTRGYLTLTGTYKNVPVSIVGVGMGVPMIDMAIRELSAVVDGKMAFIRIGTCGTPFDEAKCGDIVCHESSVMISRNPNGFRKNSEEPCYLISEPVDASQDICDKLFDNAKDMFGEKSVHKGMNGTACSFYSSQGRVTSEFDDRNSQLVDKQLLGKYPNVKSLEMETFHLFDLAECSKGKIIAGSACLILAQRKSGLFIDLELKAERETKLGKVALESIIKVDI
eukprot:gene8384-209_t